MQQIQNHLLVDLSADYVNLRNYHVMVGAKYGSELAFIAPPSDSLTVSNHGLLISDGYNSLIDFQGGVGPSKTWGGGDTMTVSNSGTILAENGGAIAIQANVTQTPDGLILARNGSAIYLSGIASGGTLKLNNASLTDAPMADAQQLDAGFTKGVVHYDDIQSNVILAGASDKIQFNQATGPLSEVWDAAKHDLTVFENILPGHLGGNTGEVQMASLHLVGNYHASEFAVSGDQLIYTKV